MQWNKLCKLNKFKESDHHRSLVTYDDIDYDNYLLNDEDNLCKLNKHMKETNAYNKWICAQSSKSMHKVLFNNYTNHEFKNS